MPVKATSAALPSKTFDGTVTAVDNKIDPDSRTLQIQATLPNPDGMIKAGMSFSIDMSFPGETFTSVDPLSIQWSTDGAYVWKVVDNKAQMAKITIIQRNSDGVLVEGDLKEGEPIITEGVLQLQEGTAVTLLGAKPEQAYFVRCDRTTMTQNDLDNGRLVCQVGVAALRPAEYVIFRIGQWTADRKV